MKYAYLIPIYNTISGRLLPQFLHLQDWCRNLDGEIFTVVGRTHVDARNWLCTDGGGYANPTKLIDRFDNVSFSFTILLLSLIVCWFISWYIYIYIYIYIQ